MRSPLSRITATSDRRRHRWKPSHAVSLFVGPPSDVSSFGSISSACEYRLERIQSSHLRFGSGIGGCVQSFADRDVLRGASELGSSAPGAEARQVGRSRDRKRVSGKIDTSAAQAAYTASRRRHRCRLSSCPSARSVVPTRGRIARHGRVLRTAAKVCARGDCEVSNFSSMNVATLVRKTASLIACSQ